MPQKRVTMKNLMLLQQSMSFAENVHGRFILFVLNLQFPADLEDLMNAHCVHSSLPPVTGCGQQPAEKNM